MRSICESIIGEADGPTTIFLAESTGWINLFGVVIVVLILIPNILYALKVRGGENKCTNKIMNLIEQIGRYTSIFFLISNIGIDEFGFRSPEDFIIYLIGNSLLLISYWSIWILFFRKKKLWNSMALAIIPTIIFLLSGVTLRHYLLIVSAMVFGIGHIYVTYQNAKE